MPRCLVQVHYVWHVNNIGDKYVRYKLIKILTKMPHVVLILVGHLVCYKNNMQHNIGKIKLI